MSDIRTAARREAERVMPLTGGVMDGGRETWHRGFAHGAVWGAARVTPTRDEVADALAGAYDEWCSLLQEFLAGRGDDPGSEYEYKADAVLALLSARAESL